MYNTKKSEERLRVLYQVNKFSVVDFRKSSKISFFYRNQLEVNISMKSLNNINNDLYCC